MEEEFKEYVGGNLKDFTVLDAFDSLFLNGKANQEAQNPSKYLLYQDPMAGTFDREVVESMKIWRELLGYVKLIVIVVAITLVINNVVLINAKIPSPSMEKTLMVKDRLFGFRLAYGINLNLFGYEISEKFKDPERFDIVIFKYPDDESRLFIKRVIGLPGEVVEIKDGKVYIDGSPTSLDDSFIPEKMIGSYGPYTVPENSYFMLGDNRNDSKDSRSWKNKFVRFDQLVGKAIVRYYPSFKWLG